MTVRGRAFLLDVNVLIALFDPDHVHHETAHDWFADHQEQGWATCPTTENGFVRVLANAAYGAGLSRPSELTGRLDRLRRASSGHRFWPDEVSLCDTTLFKPIFIRGYRQVTDVYLLGLAVKMGGRLATFDRTIPVSAVVGATRASLAVVAPAAAE
jgi:toxin-antitoxin system PIN domain toxin